MLLDIVTYPNEVLRMKCEKVGGITDEVVTFCHNLAETMLAKDGVGLAAIQVGSPMQVFVLNDNGPKFFINPELHFPEDAVIVEEVEGCLSFPGLFTKIKRHDKVEVSAVGLDSIRFGMRATGLMARALQHEYDHASGMLLIDHLSHLKREMVLKKYRKQRKY